MPAKRRTSKRRPEDELSFRQLSDLMFAGPLGRRGHDGRVGVVWDTEDDRRAAYLAHRDRVLAGFLHRGTPPPHAIDHYEPDPDVRAQAVAYWADRYDLDLDGLTPAEARQRCRPIVRSTP